MDICQFLRRTNADTEKQNKSQLKDGKWFDKEASRNPELEFILLKLQCTEGVYLISPACPQHYRVCARQHHLDLLPNRCSVNNCILC